MKKLIAGILVIALICTALCSCGKNSEINKNLDLTERVVLKICGPWTSCKALENAFQTFNKKYSNCELEYEYVQNYNDSLVKRLDNNPESIDLFLTENIQKDSVFYPYAEELFAHSELNLSDTNEALIKNFTFLSTDSSVKSKLYSIPLGGDLRGLYVNKTLLNSVGASVPKNITEFLSVCKKLKDAGYIPVMGNPGMFGQRLLYPYVADLVVHSDNYKETYNKVNNCEQGISELFRKPMELLYTLNKENYYNYKYVENEFKMFTDNSDEGCARYFFNVLQDGDDFVKKDDIGTVAFTTGTLSQQTTMEKTKEDYHSNIDYEFALAPVSDKGGFAYTSPAKGIAVNKNSSHMDWAIEFLGYLFIKDINTKFASDINYIPNTKNSFDVIRDKFDIPDNQISDLGQMTFDYSFYNTINDNLVIVSKSNNPKYMDKDENGNSVMYSFDYYMNLLEKSFAEQRENGAKE